jgi:molybdopterin synthase catalytic subunit
MAAHQLQRLAHAALERWPLTACRIVHRLGHLDLGEIAVAIAVSSPHRAEAFAAAEWLMNSIKRDVPIWKRENYRDGQAEWVHPVTDPSGGGS